MFNSEKILLVLVCEIYFWVSYFFYTLEICCLSLLFIIRQNLVFILNCVADEQLTLVAVQMLLPILPLLSYGVPTEQTHIFGLYKRTSCHTPNLVIHKT